MSNTTSKISVGRGSDTPLLRFQARQLRPLRRPLLFSSTLCSSTMPTLWPSKPSPSCSPSSGQVMFGVVCSGRIGWSIPSSNVWLVRLPASWAPVGFVVWHCQRQNLRAPRQEGSLPARWARQAFNPILVLDTPSIWGLCPSLRQTHFQGLCGHFCCHRLWRKCLVWRTPPRVLLLPPEVGL